MAIQLGCERGGRWRRRPQALLSPVALCRRAHGRPGAGTAVAPRAGACRRSAECGMGASPRVGWCQGHAERVDGVRAHHSAGVRPPVLLVVKWWAPGAREQQRRCGRQGCRLGGSGPAAAPRCCRATGALRRLVARRHTRGSGSGTSASSTRHAALARLAGASVAGARALRRSTGATSCGRDGGGACGGGERGCCCEPGDRGHSRGGG